MQSLSRACCITIYIFTQHPGRQRVRATTLFLKSTLLLYAALPAAH